MSWQLFWSMFSWGKHMQFLGKGIWYMMHIMFIWFQYTLYSYHTQYICRDSYCIHLFIHSFICSCLCLYSYHSDIHSALCNSKPRPFQFAELQEAEPQGRKRKCGRKIELARQWACGMVHVQHVKVTMVVWKLSQGMINEKPQARWNTMYTSYYWKFSQI